MTVSVLKSCSAHLSEYVNMTYTLGFKPPQIEGAISVLFFLGHPVPWNADQNNSLIFEKNLIIFEKNVEKC